MIQRQYVFFFLPLLVIFCFIPVSFLAGQDIDLADPEKVANHALIAIQEGDADAMLQVMDPEQKKMYLPLTPDKRLGLQKMMENDKEKIGRVKKVSEIRECTTLSGKPGAAAKIRQKSDELYVIILANQDNLYYYENLLTVTPDVYRNLKLIKKVR
ncbi:MAG: hypothetical protein JSV88_26185 [Candidatus Aminicenantes bacterium]|nr:MAG: hypothetical protein JSV88_26185 [Candidatus Aminicenantes bacterium]